MDTNVQISVEPDAPDLDSYDRILIAFSGGKDSLACVLHLLDLGYKDKIELHHHDVDGGGDIFMDWPCTRAYVMEVARVLDLPVFFSFKEGGFQREMLRDGTPTAPIHFQTPGGQWIVRGGNGPAGRRQLFPQASADLRVRWCSAYLKIDVMDAVIRGQARFEGIRTLVITGERAQESANRARYKALEPHRADARGPKLRRHIDAWRPILGWPEEAVWMIIRDHGIVPHPAYYLGWGRLSCMTCIFGSPDQWASVDRIDPWRIMAISGHERRFGKTIHRNRSVISQIKRGVPYEAIRAKPYSDGWKRLALSPKDSWDSEGYPVLVEPHLWEQPAGAYGEKTGPT